uniref:Uncharacterized protein n=1 Tax=Globodera rostochiensis TaxID=31243 RepID=A0A914HAJ6_GLORO
MPPKRQNEQFVEESQKQTFGDSSKDNNNGARKFKQEKPDNDVIILNDDDDDDDRKPLLEKPALTKRGRKPRWDKQQQEQEELPPKKIRANESDGDEKSQTSVFDYPTIFWKLARPKYGTFTFMCKDCQTANFQMGDRRFMLTPQNGEGRLEFTQTFCRDCAKLNFDCTDLIMKHQKKDAPTKNGHYHPYTGGNNTPGFVGNKTNKFKVHLPKKLVFEGPGWMVGMSGIIYPNSWATVGTLEKQYVIVHLRDGRKYRFKVPRGSFLSPQQLERGIHHGMIAEMERLMTRKRAAFQEDEEEEGELVDVQVVEEEEGGLTGLQVAKEERKESVEAPLLPMSQTKFASEQAAERTRQPPLANVRPPEQRGAVRERELVPPNETERLAQEKENERKRKAQKWIEDGRKETERRRQEALRKETERLQRMTNATKEGAASKKKEEEKLGTPKQAPQQAVNERLEKQKEEERFPKQKEAAEKKEEDRLAKQKEETEKKEEESSAKQPEDVGNRPNKGIERAVNPAGEEERIRRDQERKFKLRELELLKELKPYRGGWMRLVQGKDPTPDVHYLHEKDEYHFSNAVDKYRIHHPELAWDLPEFNPSAQIQRNIAEFKGLFEREVYDENYGSKTREEKEELIALVKGFRFYYMEDIGRFMLKIFDNKISHITLTDQLAYVLGYEQEQQILNEDLAKYSVDLGGGVSHLCIYLNSGIIESMIFGNTFANLLQVIAVEGKSGSVVEKDFQSPLFHKIIAREVDVLDVEIRTLTGRYVYAPL